MGRAYGLALYLTTQLLLVPLVLFRSGSGPLTAETMAQGVLLVVLIALFFVAGRSLSKGTAQSGRIWPWVAVSALTTVPILFIQAFANPTGSMEATLLVGDRILVQRFPTPSVQRGSIIVFVYPIDRQQTFIKRVIGIPGDRIRIANKVLYRNGVAVQEPYAVHKGPYPDSYRDNFPSEPNFTLAAAALAMLKNNVVNGEVVVPDRSYFVLGDNRDNSLDSRYWGFIDFGDLIGKPLLIYDSEDQSDLAFGGKPSGLHRTRWNRLFKML